MDCTYDAPKRGELLILQRGIVYLAPMIAAAAKGSAAEPSILLSRSEAAAGSLLLLDGSAVA